MKSEMSNAKNFICSEFFLAFHLFFNYVCFASIERSFFNSKTPLVQFLYMNALNIF